jgi:hypothetical protein
MNDKAAKGVGIIAAFTVLFVLLIAVASVIEFM